MRGLRMMVVAIVCAGSVVAAHGQIGGDEPGGHPQASAPAPASKPMRIASAVMQGQLLKKVEPVCPGDAHVQGTVVLHVIIGKNGRVESAQVVTGPAMLTSAAVDAVRQWLYQSYLLNGEPVEVDTTITLEIHCPRS